MTAADDDDVCVVEFTSGFSVGVLLIVFCLPESTSINKVTPFLFVVYWLFLFCFFGVYLAFILCFLSVFCVFGVYIMSNWCCVGFVAVYFMFSLFSVVQLFFLCFCVDRGLLVFIWVCLCLLW